MHPTLHISVLQVSLFMQEGFQVDGARVVLPQPVSTGSIPQVGTATSYAADGQLSPPLLPPACRACFLAFMLMLVLLIMITIMKLIMIMVMVMVMIMIMLKINNNSHNK